MFSISRDLSLIYLGYVQSKYLTQFFDPLIDRAIQLISIKPESVSILNEKKYIVQGMIYSLFPEFQIIGQDENGDPIYGKPDDSEPISFAKNVFQNINNLELSSDDSFSWPQYFGLLALMEIDSYIIQNDWVFEEMDTPPSHIPNWDEVVANSRITTLLSVSETVCFGEVLEAKNLPTSGLIKDKISKQSQNAMRIRYQPLNDIKSDFIKFYIDSSDKSNKSEIARKFYRSLSKNQQRIITSTLKIENACRTLVNHLNKVLNLKPFSMYS
ncbi:MAG: hypothetical protein COA95_08100 [Methylophaga sp.]|nr:MAG: hypothetical protein COA95_08100 [Methylophaga sp.]